MTEMFGNLNNFRVQHDGDQFDFGTCLGGEYRWVPELIEAGGDMFWWRHGEYRHVPNETLAELLRVAKEHAAMHEARGVNEFDPVVLNWEDAAKVEPPTP